MPKKEVIIVYLSEIVYLHYPYFVLICIWIHIPLLLMFKLYLMKRL